MRLCMRLQEKDMDIKLVFCVIYCIGYALSQQSPITCEMHSDEITCLQGEVNSKLEQLYQLMHSRSPCRVQDAVPCENLCELDQTSDILHSNVPVDCDDIYNAGKRDSGVYTIYEPLSIYHYETHFRSFHRRTINVFCDFDSSHKWLVFQRRTSGHTNFTQSWDTYKDGFGNLEDGFWLGNDNLAIITQGERAYRLRIELTDWSGDMKFAEYSTFSVSNETYFYRLDLGQFTGTAGDSLASQDSAYFSTYDQDHDTSSNNCAQSYSSGFWFSSCGLALLNNPYQHGGTREPYKGIVWGAWHGIDYSLKGVEMKIRPTN